MENYDIVQQLPKGGHNLSYLVISNIDGQKYVMKKIECIDESAANKAFSEVQALFRLKHTHVSFPCDAFVCWDSKVSGMFLCTISPFYEHGDLLSLIKEKRLKKQHIDEKQVVWWFSELVAATSYIHGLSVPHRDIKPSNIYLSRDTDIVLGDCGLNCVMADIRMRTRQTKGAMDWMAPEIIEQPFDMASDVWSLGCIILELMTCSIWDTAEMAGHLSAIKHDKNALEKLLNEVAKHYSKDLVSVVKEMLSINASERPTILYIVELPILKANLQKLSDATKLKTVAPTGKAKPLPQPSDVNTLLQYLVTNGSSLSSVLAGLQELCHLTADQVASPSAESKHAILACLETYEEYADVQTMGCQILAQLASTAQQDDPIYHPRMCNVLIKALKTHSDNAEVLRAVVALVTPVATCGSSALKLGRDGAVQSVVSILQTFVSDKVMCVLCYNALWALCSIDENLRIATDEKVAYFVVASLQNHTADADVVEACCAALVSLALKDENIALINELCCVGSLLEILGTAQLSAPVISKACLLLSILIEADEESAYQMLSAPKPDGKEIAGIPIIVKLYTAHRDNVDVVKNLVAVIAELTEYNDIASELKHMDITSKMLSEVRRRFTDRPEIKQSCDVAMQRVL